MSSRAIRGLLLLALAGLALVSACGPSRPTVPPVPAEAPEQQAGRLLNQGQVNLAAGNYLMAGEFFKATLDQNPPRPQAAQAVMGLIQAEQGAKRPQEAMRWAQIYLTRYPDLPGSGTVIILTARLERDLGRPDDALARLRKLLATPPPDLTPAQRLEARQQIAATLNKTGRSAEALRELLEVAELAGPGQGPELADDIADAAGKLPYLEVKSLLPLARQAQARAALLLGLARAALKEGRFQEAQEALGELSALPAPPAYAERMTALDKELAQAKAVSPGAVGVVLPLTGNYAAHGRRILAAVQLGLGLFGGGEGVSPTLYIEDDRGDAAQGAQAVSNLAEGRKVMAIIGPLSASASLAAARRAQTLGVPLITLTQVEGVTAAGDFVFQNFFSPAEQVEAILEEAMGARGLKRFAMLIPQNAYGQGFAKLFREAVAARGGQVVRAVNYQPSAADFTGDVKSLVRLPPGDYRPGHPDSPKPVIDFEAVFIPDGAERAGNLASQLAYFDVTPMTLLGTNLWHDPRILEVGGRYLGGAIFPDAFDPASEDPQVQRFVREYTQAEGQEPNLLDAHGFDAALLVRRLLAAPQPPRTRLEMRDALAAVKNAPGVCGLLSVASNRRVTKRLTLFTVRAGVFKPLNAPVPLPELIPAAPAGGADDPGELIAPSIRPAAPATGGELPPAPAATIPR